MRNKRNYNESLDENKLNELFDHLRSLNQSNQLDEYCQFGRLINTLQNIILEIDDKKYVERKLKQIECESIDEIINILQDAIERHSNSLDKIYSDLDNLKNELP